MRIAEVAFPVPLPKGFHYQVPEGMRVLSGMRVRAPFGARRLVGTVLSVFDGEPTRALKRLEAVLDPEPVLDGELLGLVLWMSRRYGAGVGECVRAVLPAPGVLGAGVPPPLRTGRGLPAPGVLGAGVPPPLRTGCGWPPASPAPAFELTRGQEQALRSLEERLEARRFHAALLYGVPASGKTEVYLRLIRRALGSGGQALFLVPEITLSEPFFAEFSKSLGDSVVLWHSRLGSRERRLAWRGLKEGRLSAVVGARSAALLAFADLRLIVLDEEQDESFKQEGQSPLYHAREVALERGRSWRALVVLGSATPSLESWEMARRGEVQLLTMPERVSPVARPAVAVLPRPPAGRCLSEELVQKLKERLGAREQAILLVNRRGFANFLICSKCGFVERCAACGVAKIEHEAPGGGFLLRCHHCESKAPLPERCPQCAAAAWRSAGLGTQRVVSELKRLLPGARVLRLDRDTLSAQGKGERRIHERFMAREADVLVGTKLVAKGFHFPEVTLVGVVDADTMLHMPDFRAAERTMQLLAQVAGRSGRAGKRGEVLLQTLQPGHGAIAGAVRGDYASFAEGELSARKELGYPPYSILVRLIWAGKPEAAVRLAAEEAAARLRERLEGAGHQVVGPAPAVVRLARGRFRYHLLLKSPSGELERALEAVRACERSARIKLKVNVDPYDLF